MFDETTHVRVELRDEECDQFRTLARMRGLTLDEAGREAVGAMLRRHGSSPPGANAPGETDADGDRE